MAGDHLKAQSNATCGTMTRTDILFYWKQKTDVYVENRATYSNKWKTSSSTKNMYICGKGKVS